MFRDRSHAGQLLADKVVKELAWNSNKRNFVVVGLPRGGVPVAAPLAAKLKAPIDLIVSKKLPYPGQPEVAIGAVSADGTIVLRPDIPREEVWQTYIKAQQASLIRSTLAQERMFYESAGYAQTSFADKTVIVVDDGIATGMTVFAAIRSARKKGASKIIVAAPVISADTYQKLHMNCDAIISLSIPAEFTSVGHHYVHFEQTTNEEVIAAMRMSQKNSLREHKQQDGLAS